MHSLNHQHLVKLYGLVLRYRHIFCIGKIIGTGGREGSGGRSFFVDERKCAIMHSLNHQHLVKLYELVLDMDSSLVLVRLLEMEGGRGLEGGVA